MKDLALLCLIGAGLIGLTVAQAQKAVDKPVGKSKAVIGKITWHTDYDAALALAKKENRPVWLHFGENPG